MLWHTDVPADHRAASACRRSPATCRSAVIPSTRPRGDSARRRSLAGRVLSGLLLAALGTELLAACAGAPVQPVAPSGSLAAADVRWLNRITYSVDTPTLERFVRLGRARFLEQQLNPGAEVLPAPVSAQIVSYASLARAPGEVLASVRREHERINALAGDDQKQAARQALRQAGAAAATEAKSRLLLRALYSPNQLNEQLVWFWLNHFSVHEPKGSIAPLLGDYEERAIRPHALGHFRDLVIATATHPAMLEYLDNQQNAVRHVNENYARELMELHTLGVNGGYTQADVQELARVLTGFGVEGALPPRLPRNLEHYYRHGGGFEFNPARHDFGRKQLLGHVIDGTGYDELAQAVDVLVRQSACAHFVSRRLAEYFVADEPPPALVERAARTFQKTDGDIRAVLRTLLDSPEFEASLGTKYKDPVHYVVAALRISYDGHAISNLKPAISALQSLDEGLYARATPDGYPLDQAAWTSSGQIAKRLDIARALGNGNPALFQRRDGDTSAGPAFAQLSNRLYFSAIEPGLSQQTRQTLAQARSPQEWNALLLASPELNFR